MHDLWFSVQELHPNTYAISEYGHWEKVHSFLLIGEKRAALIDTGLGIDSIKRMTEQLTDLPIDVITTHVHVDHIGGHGEFERLYVHSEEADWLEKGIKGLTLDQIRKDIGRDLTKSPPQSFNPDTYTPFTGKPTGLLEHKDRLDLGGRTLVVHHTPGHSPGHLVVEDLTNGLLFTGDLLYIDSPIYAFYPTTDPVKLLDSLAYTSRIPSINNVYGSHNTLSIPNNIWNDVNEAVRDLREKDLAHFGTGVHTYGLVEIRF
ncbi:MBL fold metallo-hydrolase [Geomicrobium sp. JCM 19038]|uniref:MBL fold metallo-hydrolase n=1 Tax=Geomicrobium sp. JCM 19038 TaxID=1460635 RepID=UPI00045F2A60|nr:MBL fold metallo-hydrolase [Geomicrobium sp. JCM 19038]GAK08230.1 possible Zn-dependent hydrolase, beta-lactamase superfamily [Geomicrobium sp. JCM 19038]